MIWCAAVLRRYQNPELVLFPERIAIPWENATCANSDWTLIVDGTVTRSQEDWSQWVDGDRTTVVADSSCVDVLWERRSTLRQAVLDCAQVRLACWCVVVVRCRTTLSSAFWGHSICAHYAQTADERACGCGERHGSQRNECTAHKTKTGVHLPPHSPHRWVAQASHTTKSRLLRRLQTGLPRFPAQGKRRHLQRSH